MSNLLSWADHHVFDSSDDPLVFVINDASLFSLNEEAREILRKWRSSEFVDLEKVSSPDIEVLKGLRDAQILLPVLRTQEMPLHLRPASVPLSTLVLEVAQDCNLQCSYCYAEAGTYGSAPCLLTPELARQAVRYLFDSSADLDHVTLIFFGGEPLMNMPAIRAAIDEATTYGSKSGKKAHFSLTTNGTFLNPEIVEFLHSHRVAVAISMDGPRHIHDRNRPDQNGKGTYAEIVSRLGVLLKDSPVPVAARVTLEPDQWYETEAVFDHLVGLGFHEVGIAPVSPVTKALLPDREQEKVLLKNFESLAGRFITALTKGQVLPFSNILDLLARIHIGQSKPISCGAGFGYMAMDARGRFFPCHRMAGEKEYCSGDLATGIDTDVISSSLDSLNNGREKSCSRCWARTLCAGGCHYENHLRENQLGLPRGTSCGFIRNWLSLGIKTYASLRTDQAIESIGRRLQERAQC